MEAANGVKAILFDFDGTLRHNLPTGGEVFTEYVIDQGLQVTNEDRRRAAIWEHYYFASSPEIKADLKKNRGEEDFWFNFAHRRLAALGCAPELVPEIGPKVSQYMQENYAPVSFIPEEIHTVIPSLRESGYTLGVVSNRDDPYQKEIDDLGMQNYFQFSLAAGEVNSWKPDPGIFQHALELTNTTPKETLYIGDNFFADVIGARRAGLQPVLYDPQRLFHEPGCPVITSFEHLIDLLKQPKS